MNSQKNQDKSYCENGVFNSGLFRNCIEEAMMQSVLKHPSRIVLLALLSKAHDKPNCWPSILYIKKYTGMGKTAILEHITILEKGGWIQKTKRPKKNGIGNEYLILIPSTGTPREPVHNTNHSVKRYSSGTSGEPEQVRIPNPNTNTNIKKNTKGESDIFSKKEKVESAPQQRTQDNFNRGFEEAKIRLEGFKFSPPLLRREAESYFREIRNGHWDDFISIQKEKLPRIKEDKTRYGIKDFNSCINSAI